MKNTLATLLLCAGLSLAGTAVAQAPAATPAAAAADSSTAVLVPNAAVGTVLAPNVQSVDILDPKQNQAERSRDQPGNAAPTFRTIKEGVENYSSLPALESGVLIQPKAQFPFQARATTAGEAWRNYRNGPLTSIGGWLIIAAVIILALVYVVKGKVLIKSGLSGRVIERFTSVERIAHWSTAITFVLLAVSGLIMLFGKFVLMPLFGHTLFGWLAFACKNIHNFVGPAFTVSIIVTFIVFVKDNFPSKGDLQWILSMGGLLGGKHAHAGRFNAGEKLWFWIGVVTLSLIVSASGFVLDMLVPGMVYSRGNMQVAHVVHLIGAVLVTAMSLGHIYLGSIGMEGAYGAMKTGYVDDNWAREHHDLWYDDVQSGKVPRIRTEKAAAVVGRTTSPPPTAAT